MESESIALPLGDTPTEMGWIVGFEPTHNGATTRCLNHLTIPTTISFIGLTDMEATPGFEPGNKGFADLCLTTWLCRHMLVNCADRFVRHRRRSLTYTSTLRSTPPCLPCARRNSLRMDRFVSIDTAKTPRGVLA